MQGTVKGIALACLGLPWNSLVSSASSGSSFRLTGFGDNNVEALVFTGRRKAAPFFAPFFCWDCTWRNLSLYNIFFWNGLIVLEFFLSKRFGRVQISLMIQARLFHAKSYRPLFQQQLFLWFTVVWVLAWRDDIQVTKVWIWGLEVGASKICISQRPWVKLTCQKLFASEHEALYWLTASSFIWKKYTF